MTDERPPASGKPHIKLKTVAAMFQSKVEGRTSVLRDGARHTCAAMTEQ
jgi:hypothetical protein